MAGIDSNNLSTTNNLINSLGDYGSIKNGSYGKLLKSYYAKEKEQKAGKDSETIKEENLMLNSAKSAADNLKATVNTLLDKELFVKKAAEDGKEDYDWDAITKAVKSFVEDYNEVLKSADDVDDRSTLQSVKWMTDASKTSSKLLGSIGITIGEGNELKLDETVLKKAKMEEIKTLFSDSNSYAGKILQKAQQIVNNSDKAISKNSAYTSKGSANNSAVGKLFNEEI